MKPTQYSLFSRFIMVLLCLQLIVITANAQGIGFVPKPVDGKDPNGGLTDQDKVLSTEFVHEGLSREEKDEACKGQEKVCEGQKIGQDYLGLNSNLIEALAKAYSMVIGVAGGNFKNGDYKDKADLKPGEKLEEGQKEKEVTDYCKYIAVGTEAIALFNSTSSTENVSNLPTNQDTAQKDMLYKAARSHDKRADSHKIQAIGWTASAGCYLIYLTQPVKTDWTFWAKLAGSGLLAAFFWLEEARYRGYAKTVKDIANKLPGKGDCNPVTENDCYCAHETTKNDVQHCFPQLKARHIADTSFQISCLDQNIKPDPSCNCLASDSCFDNKLIGMSAGLNLGTATQSNLLGPSRKLFRGEAEKGNISGSLTGRNNALRDKLLNETKTRIPDKNLNQADSDAARDLASKFNVPISLAKHAVGLPGSATADAKSRFQGNGGYLSPTANNSGAYASRSNVLYFGGGGAGSGAKAKGKDDPDFKSMFGKKGQEKAASGRSIMKFADRASQSAEITRDSSRGLFEIISRRYKVTAQSRLEIQF